MDLKVVKNATCTFCGCVCDDIELHADHEKITHTRCYKKFAKFWVKTLRFISE